MYIIFQGPKPITLCGLIGSKFNSIVRFSEDLFTKCHHHFKMKHFNQSFGMEDLFTSMKVIRQRILSIFQFTFCTGLYFLFQFPALFKAVIQNP